MSDKIIYVSAKALSNHNGVRTATAISFSSDQIELFEAVFIEEKEFIEVFFKSGSSRIIDCTYDEFREDIGWWPMHV